MFLPKVSTGIDVVGGSMVLVDSYHRIVDRTSNFTNIIHSCISRGLVNRLCSFSLVLLSFYRLYSCNVFNVKVRTLEFELKLQTTISKYI